jgi:hypothetical protein
MLLRVQWPFLPVSAHSALTVLFGRRDGMLGTGG